LPRSNRRSQCAVTDRQITWNEFRDIGVAQKQGELSR
jgi:hypothetical protein